MIDIYFLKNKKIIGYVFYVIFLKMLSVKSENDFIRYLELKKIKFIKLIQNVFLIKVKKLKIKINLYDNNHQNDPAVYHHLPSLNLRTIRTK